MASVAAATTRMRTVATPWRARLFRGCNSNSFVRDNNNGSNDDDDRNSRATTTTRRWRLRP